MDGYHYYRSELDAFPDAREAHRRRGAPFTFNAKRLVKDLQTISLGSEDVFIPSFNHEDKDPVEDAIVVKASDRIVIVEGLYLLYNEEPWDQLRDLFAASLYLSTPLEVALERCALRNSKALGISLEAAQDRVQVNDKVNALLVEGTRTRATHQL